MGGQLAAAVHAQGDHGGEGAAHQQAADDQPGEAGQPGGGADAQGLNHQCGHKRVTFAGVAGQFAPQQVGGHGGQAHGQPGIEGGAVQAGQLGFGDHRQVGGAGDVAEAGQGVAGDEKAQGGAVHRRPFMLAVFGVGQGGDATQQGQQDQGQRPAGQPHGGVAAAQAFYKGNGEGGDADAQADARIVNIAQPGSQMIGHGAQHQGGTVDHDDGAGHPGQKAVDGPGGEGGAQAHEQAGDDTCPQGQPERGAGPVGGYCHGEHGTGQVAAVVDGRQVAAADGGEGGLCNHVGQGRGEQEAANAQGNHQAEGAGDGGEQVISVCGHQHDSVLSAARAGAIRLQAGCCSVFSDCGSVPPPQWSAQPNRLCCVRLHHSNDVHYSSQ